MYKLSSQDEIIIKECSNWATRSVSKLRTLLKSTEGKSLRNILSKANRIDVELKESYDAFVSKVNHKYNDDKAVGYFIKAGEVTSSLRDDIIHYVDNISASKDTDIVKFIQNKEAQELENARNIEEEEKRKRKEGKTPKDGYKEPPTSAESEVLSGESTQRTPSKPSKPSKDSQIDESLLQKDSLSSWLSNIVTELQTIAIPEGDDRTQNSIKQEINKLNNDCESILPFLSDNAIENESAFKSIQEIEYKVRQLKDNINKLIAQSCSEKYNKLIKNAKTSENVTAYYLLSLADYGPIKTRIKDRMLKFKEFFVKDTVYEFRRDCITKIIELLENTDSFQDDIESFVKTQDQLQRWISIIDSFNRFSTEYNNRRDYFVRFYRQMKLHQQEEKAEALRNKDKSKENADYVYERYVDLPSFTDSKFPKIKLINGKDFSKR